MADVTYVSPKGLEPEVRDFGKFKAVRFRHPTARMELNLLYGHYEDVLPRLTPTRVSFHPPEGQKGLKPSDKAMLGKMVLGGIKADLAVQLAQDGQDEATTLAEREGETKKKYAYVEEKLRSRSAGLQCTSILFDTRSDTIAVLAYRAAVEHEKDVDGWKDQVLHSIVFV